MHTLLRIGPALVLSASLASFADQPDRAGEKKRGPSPEAIAACKDKSDGQSCTFGANDRTAAGSCYSPSRDLPLACKPEGAPDGREPGPAR